jgi:hypothetical protein
MTQVNNTSLTTLTSNLNLNVRRPFLELMLKVNGIKIGIAIGINGLLIAISRFDQRWLVAIGRWGTRR